jgi:hypothetical protein
MSDNWIIVIPENPEFVPDKATQQKAAGYLHSIAPKADEITSTVSDHIEFADCGGNFEGVSCPSCCAAIEIEVWQDWMDEDYDGEGFVLRSHVMPCCGTGHTVHELRYEAAQGFRRFEVSAMNPNIELSDAQRKGFEEILGCLVRVIWRHM